MTDRSKLSVFELKLKKIASLSQWYTNKKVNNQSVTLTTKAQPNTGYLKTYVLGIQSGGTIGEIDIPKDFLVKSAQTIYVEASGATPMVTKVNGQAVTPYVAPSGAQTTGIYLDFIINVASGTTVSDDHVCVKMNDLVDVYTGGSGITIDANKAVSVRISNNGGFEFDGQRLKVDIDTVTPNGLHIDTNSGISLDLATWVENASGGTGTNGAMSAEDKKEVIDNNNDLLVDTELASWFGYGENRQIKEQLSRISNQAVIVYSEQYLTIVPTENGTISFSKNGLQYSTDKQNWSNLGTSALAVTQGTKVYLKGTMTPSTSDPQGIGTFSSTNGFNVEGNAMSLLYGDNYIGQTSLSGKDYAFCKLFSGCTRLVSAENLSLPATTLASYCYYYMFDNCRSLATIPTLPATTLANYCYAYMFSYCRSLAFAPALPATTLANYCYAYMFYECRLLASAPALPATTLTNACYQGMFLTCRSLAFAPALRATTLADWCYGGMFAGCTSLATAPELPATTLADWCYHDMFGNCTSLTTAPELPATTLASYCYVSMFNGCSGLTTAPELPATTLTQQCYHSMFANCTSLTTAPELPATTLTIYCYDNMFHNCTSLATAPELPATTLAAQCYSYMFRGCTSLNYIKCLATNISATNCTSNWVSGVAATGTFVKNPNMSSWTTGTDGIPGGWTVEDASS